MPLAPEQEYEVRLFQPDDALGVCRSVYRNYGNTYFHEACYFPERMVALNETGELASVVAVAADGEVVGHYALERPDLTRVAERGMAVVAPGPPRPRPHDPHAHLHRGGGGAGSGSSACGASPSPSTSTASG